MPTIADKSVLPLSVNEHGGGCCGVTHLHGFPTQITSESKRVKKDCVDLILAGISEALEYNYGHAFDAAAEDDDDDIDDDKRAEVKAAWTACIEVVITDDQKKLWHEPLLLTGFELMTSFKNRNSGNVCNIYHLITGDRP